MATPQAAQTSRPPSATYRVLVWGLLLFCISLALVGGVVAEQVMAALNCQYRADPRTGSCSFLQHALASGFAPFLSAETPLDYPFMLLRNFWGLILVWLAAIAWSRHAWLNPRQAPATRRAPVPTAISLQQGLHKVLHASFWILLVGLIAFCIAFGTPFLSTWLAREILQTLGCSPGSFDPLVSACMSKLGFWTPRLQPFLLPFLGQLGSPLWLFWQFGDVLVYWFALTALVLALKVYVASRIAVTKVS
ncbi:MULTISPECIES: hypothetical protein [unclassified Polaromonas]|uniref:hypothetical protein n=1 Tax=unclassified Polaromonas TaxID=2638319 RepID=UPI000F0811C9|nr:MULTISPECIES: hypothetical protein [unclassified Polaromonas]AYQ30081.1 hypothetical protein DT070_19915 [Polaromonas sp. SP1]QGJ18803.1 hypothetical protein F7R28_10645 [Polaromonas sp. Pch-P]